MIRRNSPRRLEGSMHRRTFLGIGSAALAATAAPGALVRLLAQGPAAGPDVVVETASGRLRGAVDAGVRIFRGVPYAAAPTGNLRFMPPVKPQPWTGVRDA